MYCQPEKFLYSKKLKRKGTNKIGEGKYGQVFVGCTKKICSHQIAVKKSRDDMSHEYKMMQKAYKIAPHHVPRPYQFVKCNGGSIIYYEFIKSKTLSKSKIDKNVLFKILKTLYKFQKQTFLQPIQKTNLVVLYSMKILVLEVGVLVPN